MKRNPGVAIRRRLLEIDGLKLYSEVAGAGPPVVLLHGLSGSTRWWSRNVGALARSFEVHTLDLVGFGQSKAARPFQLAAAAGVIAGWMDKAGLERAAVVGHSMGGLVAAELAADYPQRVERLALVAAALPAVGLDAFGALATPGELVRALPHLPFSFLDLLLPDLLRAGLPTVVAALRELLATDISAKLNVIAAPTLLVWGECDPLVPLRQAWQLARLVPCHELAIFKGAGHNPMWERPDSFNRLLVEFLSDGEATCAAQENVIPLPQPRPMRLAA